MRAGYFGRTVGRGGGGTGPSLVLPFRGPSPLRDSAGRVVDRTANGEFLPLSTNERYGLSALQLVSIRAGLLSASRLLDEVALDRYSCLLYTSDAADERSSVDLGGRRIIKTKNKRQ